MKPILIIAMLAGVLGLAACGGTSSSDKTATAAAGVAPTVAATAPATEAPSDGNAPGIPEVHGDIVTTASGLRYINEDGRYGRDAAADGHRHGELHGLAHERHEV